jgi:hypothetical protein
VRASLAKVIMGLGAVVGKEKCAHSPTSRHFLILFLAVIIFFMLSSSC